MVEFVSFKDIQDMRSVAVDFSRALSSPENADIKDDFPDTVKRYGANVDEAEEALLEKQAACELGVREQFVTFAGLTAVGLSAIQLVPKPPQGVEASQPNLGVMVFRPWRAQGIGAQSLRHLMNVADERFRGSTYTAVRPDNVASLRMVESQGLIAIGEDDESRIIYTYTAR